MFDSILQALISAEPDTHALIGAMKSLYWLAKQEIPHTTNYVPLMELVRNMGVDYLHYLNQVSIAFDPRFYRTQVIEK